MKVTWIPDNEYSGLYESAEWQDKLAGPRSLVSAAIVFVLAARGLREGCQVFLKGRFMNVELLKKVAKHIEEEPRRLVMDSYLERQDEKHKEFFDYDAPNVPPQRFANCGTAACIAGWAVLIVDGNVADQHAIGDRAEKLLELTSVQSDRLFLVDAWPEPFGGNYMESETQEQKVKVAVDRIEHFIKTEGAE